MSQHEGLHSVVSLPSVTLTESGAFPTHSLIDRQTDGHNGRLFAEAVDAADSGKYATWNLSWDEPKAALRCHSFGHKEYTARLQNLPLFSNWVDACNHTPVIINGIRYVKPSSCESKVLTFFFRPPYALANLPQWLWGGVIGRWTAETGPDECRPHWGKIKDKVKYCVKLHFLS